MPQYLADFFFEYGVFFIMSVVSVMVKTLYTDEEQNFKTVLRSFVSALIISFLAVEYTKDLNERPTIFFYVFIASMLSDTIIKTILKASQRILANPRSIFIFFRKNKEFVIKILDLLIPDKKGKK